MCRNPIISKQQKPPLLFKAVDHPNESYPSSLSIYHCQLRDRKPKELRLRDEILKTRGSSPYENQHLQAGRTYI